MDDAGFEQTPDVPAADAPAVVPTDAVEDAPGNSLLGNIATDSPTDTRDTLTPSTTITTNTTDSQTLALLEARAEAQTAGFERKARGLQKQVEEARLDGERERVRGKGLSTALNERDAEIERLSREVERLREMGIGKERSAREASERMVVAEEKARGLASVVAQRDEAVERARTEADEARAAQGVAQAEAGELRARVADGEAAAMAAEHGRARAEAEAQGAIHRSQWLTSELEAVRAEFSKYRADRVALLSAAQTQADFQAQEAAQAQQASLSLSRRLDEAISRADLESARVDAAESRLSSETAAFGREMKTMQRLVAVSREQSDSLAQRLADSDSSIASLEQALAESRESHSAATAKVTSLSADVATADEQLQQLRTLVEASKSVETSLDAVTVAARVQRSGKSFTQVYAESITLREDLARERTDAAQLRDMLTTVLTEVQDKAADIQRDHAELLRLRADSQTSANQLADSLKEKDVLTVRLDATALATQSLTRQHDAAQRQGQDLVRQVHVLVRELRSYNQGRPTGSFTADEMADLERMVAETYAHAASSPESTDPLPASDSDSQLYISETLVDFRNEFELVVQNARLLKSIRVFAIQIADLESRLKSKDDLTAAAVMDRMAAFQAQLRALETRSIAANRERDTYKQRVAELELHLASSMSSSSLTSIPAPIASPLTQSWRGLADSKPSETEHLRAALDEVSRDLTLLKVDNDRLRFENTAAFSDAARLKRRVESEAGTLYF